ncbi:Gfo/Idh/MocA family oxidoreductase [Streptomyces sp. NPDC026672]|uniref:Gfo/Idh/MocA family protein n=1 Tax=unclassified Streptomyces TaxID=2593676 RepID=UPI0033CFE6A1
MSDELLRIGILGAAKIAPDAVVKPARLTPNVEIGAVAARDSGRAKAFAAKHGIDRVHGSYRELLDDPSIDAVYNPLPNGLHGHWTMAALRAGKHVLCEKPFTANAEEARAVLKVAEETGLVVMEAVHYRYHPVAHRMVDIVRSGELGRLRHVEAALCGPVPKRSDIRYQLGLAGGALMDPGCYAVHMVRTLADAEPEVVHARAKLRSPGVERAIRADLAFPDGVTGHIVGSLWSSDLVRLSVRAVGDRGEMRVWNPLLPHAGHRITVRGQGERRRVEKLSRRPSYAFQLDAFAAAVLDNGPVLTDAADAVRTMTVVDAVYDAAGLPLRRPAVVRDGSDAARA